MKKHYMEPGVPDVDPIEARDTDLIEQVHLQNKVKRTVIIHQLDDDSFNAEFSGISARQQILPMLKFAERNFRLRLARHEVS